MSGGGILLRLEFEIFGKVQGVFFRKFTQRKAAELGVTGWIRNTARHTVEGELEGKVDKVEAMKNWLQVEGSPQSRIDKAVFINERRTQDAVFKDFTIRQ